MIRVTGDTKPRMTRFLRRDGEPIPGLATAESISAKLLAPDLTTITKTVTIEDATTGEVYYDPSAVDLDQTGWWTEEIIITWSAGNTEHGEKPILFYVRAEFDEVEV